MLSDVTSIVTSSFNAPGPKRQSCCQILSSQKHLFNVECNFPGTVRPAVSLISSHLRPLHVQMRFDLRYGERFNVSCKAEPGNRVSRMEDTRARRAGKARRSRCL